MSLLCQNVSVALLDMKAEVPRGSACPGACSPVLPPMHHQHTQGAPFSFISWHFQIWELRTCSGLFLRPFLPKPLIPTKCVSQLVSWLVIILSISLPPLGFHFKFTFSGRASQATQSKIATPQQPPSKQTHFFPFHGFSLLMQLITWTLCFLYLPLLYPLLERKLHGGYFGFFLFPSNPQGLEKCWTQSHAPLQIFFFND